MTNNTTHNQRANMDVARVDHMHLCLRKLFRSPKRGSGNGGDVSFVETYDKGRYVVKIEGSSQLTIFDLRILLATLFVMVKRREELTREPSPQENKRRMGSSVASPSPSMVTCATDTSYAEIVREMGREWRGELPALIWDSIGKIQRTTIEVQDTSSKKSKGERHNLIWHSVTDDNKIRVELNPYLSMALIGERQYVSIYKNDIKKLSDPAVLLYTHLCAIIDLGKGCQFKLKTLVGYVWSEDDTTSKETKRKHLSRLRTEILPEMSSLGWYVQIDGDSVRIRRPAQQSQAVRQIGGRPDEEESHG